MGDDTSNDPSGDEAESTEAGSSQYPDEPIEAPGEIRVGGSSRSGGGRGGVGKSLVAVNLAVYFAQLGKSVVLVDGDATGGNLHAHFGLAASSAPEPDDLAALTQSLVATSSRACRSSPRRTTPWSRRWPCAPGARCAGSRRLRALPAEYLVIDVGPGHGAFALDMMLAADIAICVTVPEPPAIETTYRFLRAAFRRHLRKSLVRDRFRVHLLDRALRELGRLPSPIDLVRALAKIDRALAEIAWIEANRLRTQLVVNQTRVRTDLELGAWMSGLAWRHYGVALDELGHIEHDDTVWLTVRRNKPLLVDSPTSKARATSSGSRGASSPWRRSAAIAQRAPAALPPDEPTLYAVLGVTRSASDEEIRRAYKRQREIYADGRAGDVSLLDARPTEGRAAQARRSLRHPARPDPPPRLRPLHVPRAGRAAARRRARVARRSPPSSSCSRRSSRARSAPTPTSRARCCARCASRRGSSCAEISARTKIARAHLAAMEEERFGDLPAIVYVRGFLAELAKYLRLDPAQVQKTYLRRMRAAPERGRGPTERERGQRDCLERAGHARRLALRCAALRRRARAAALRRAAVGGEPVWDGHYYDFGARRIAEGLGYSDDLTVGGAPGLASVVPLSGRLQRLPRALLPPLRRVAVGRGGDRRSRGRRWPSSRGSLARHAMSRGRARVAGLIVALHPGLILYAALVMTEPLAALLTLLAFWLAVRDAKPIRGSCSGRSSSGSPRSSGRRRCCAPRSWACSSSEAELLV